MAGIGGIRTHDLPGHNRLFYRSTTSPKSLYRTILIKVMMLLYNIRHLVSRKVWKRSGVIMGRVANYRPGDFRLSGLVLSSDFENFYSPSSQPRDGVIRRQSVVTYLPCLERQNGMELILSPILVGF